ncbi:MAG: V-type ATP synthase subunit D [Dehalococcoidia bacterium]
MAEKIKFTRPELKRQRDMLTRFERYLPMLKLKQQQLQLTIQQVGRERNAAYKAAEDARKNFERYDKVMNDVAGVDVRGLGEYQDIKTYQKNIAGVAIPVFQDVVFPESRYSLFSTPVWVDRALMDLRELNKRRARLEIIERQHDLLQRELTKIIQRVNLFEKIKIPEAKENIRRIRIQLGDEMASAVGRAKIAKAKLAEVGSGAG